MGSNSKIINWFKKVGGKIAKWFKENSIAIITGIAGIIIFLFTGKEILRDRESADRTKEAARRAREEADRARDANSGARETAGRIEQCNSELKQSNGRIGEILEEISNQECTD